MASVPQLPTFTLAIYVGLVAGLVVLAVALVMLRVYGYRNRLSTVTTSASYDADAELADVNSGALIATTLSVMGSPLPDFPDEQVSTRKTSPAFASEEAPPGRHCVDDLRPAEQLPGPRWSLPRPAATTSSPQRHRTRQSTPVSSRTSANSVCSTRRHPAISA